MTVPVPTDLTAEWFTDLLKVPVTAVDVEPVGTGQLAETRRFTFTYAGDPGPASLVGKFTSVNETSARTGHVMGIYRSEVMFYRELAEKALIRTPELWAAEIDDESRFMLLLEDMSPARAGNQLDGCTVDEVRRGLAEAALLHGAYWNDESLVDRDWTYVPEGAQGFYTAEMMEQSWAHVQATYDGWLDADVAEVCARYVGAYGQWNTRRGRPRCLTHNDFRPDNMLFRDDARIALVDWQTVSFLEAGMDVAYFLSGALDRETRAKLESELLHGYLDDLQAGGVNDYSFADLLQDYRHYTFAALSVGLGATLLVKRTERGDRMLMRMITDAAHHVLDTDALELLG